MNSNLGIVNILVSTYNGNHCVKQQIDSLLNQTYKNIRIYVRDDGSNETTIKLLEEYEKLGQIVLFKENNIGYAKSFMKLLEMAETGDYWAFCDQDDIWFENKVAWAVEWLNGKTKPALFCSSYNLTKSDGITITGQVLPPKEPITFERTISECFFQGFSMTFNKELRELMLNYKRSIHCPHDLWATCLVAKFGVFKFDDRIASNHRRLIDSESSMNIISRIKWLFHEIRHGEKDITDCCKHLLWAYHDKLGDDAKMVEAFANKDSKFDRFFYKGRYRTMLSSEIVFRFLILIGKM